MCVFAHEQSMVWTLKSGGAHKQPTFWGFRFKFLAADVICLWPGRDNCKTSNLAWTGHDLSPRILSLPLLSDTMPKYKVFRTFSGCKTPPFHTKKTNPSAWRPYTTLRCSPHCCICRPDQPKTTQIETCILRHHQCVIHFGRFWYVSTLAFHWLVYFTEQKWKISKSSRSWNKHSKRFTMRLFSVIEWFNRVESRFFKGPHPQSFV